MSDYYTGEIRLFAGLFEPVGWCPCDGRLLSTSDYPALFALLGTVYGGNGTTNFALPNLLGRLPIGYGNMGGAGISTYALGQVGGTIAVTLTEAQIPLHSHSEVATTSAATSTSPGGNLLADPSDSFNLYVPYSSTNPAFTMAAAAIQPNGGGQSHNNVMPSIALRYIIALNGIFPTA